MRWLLHMGVHKTATTRVQIELRKKVSALARMGISLLDSMTLHNSPLEHYLSGEHDNVGIAARFLDETLDPSAKATVTVFEDLLGRIELETPYAHAAERLARLLMVIDEMKFPIEISPLMVVRRFDHYWLSCFRHTVKIGYPAQFESCAAALKTGIPSWQQVVLDVESVLGGPMPVRTYESFVEGDVVNITMSALGLPMEVTRCLTQRRWPWVRRRSNPALSERGVLLAETIRPLVTADEWRRHFKPLLNRHFNRYKQPDSGVFALPPRVTRAAADQYERDLAWLGHRLNLTHPPV